MLTASLPFPPSVNRLWRKWRGRMVLSPEGRNYRTAVCARLAGNGPRKPPSGGRIALCMDAFPPDRRKRDLDNNIKSVADALQDAAVFNNDEQIDLLLARRRGLFPGGRIDVRVDEFPLIACPLCGSAFSPGDN
ncbi:MAG: RusA family crossover junction endodeoxyribonuclease [Phycisphaerales bacterium]|nr:RusA family crossover junction endodeoxyribonuclease [Phycisphaerales bacterium]